MPPEYTKTQYTENKEKVIYAYFSFYYLDYSYIHSYQQGDRRKSIPCILDSWQLIEVGTSFS